jgi:hypothetical protein
MPRATTKKARAPSVPEKVIQASILRWLNTTGLLWWRQNAGTLKAGTFRVKLGPKGIPDVIVILPPNGRFLGLEVKRQGRYQNPDQRTFQANLEAAGGIYKVVRSLKEAKECLQLAYSQSKSTEETTKPSSSDRWSF